MTADFDGYTDDDHNLTAILQTVSDRTAGLGPPPDDLDADELDLLIPWADDPDTPSPLEVN